DDPHAAAPDLAEDLVILQPGHGYVWGRAVARSRGGTRTRLHGGGRFVQEVQPLQVVAQRAGDVRVARQELLPAGRLARRQRGEVLFQGLRQAWVLGGVGRGGRGRGRGGGRGLSAHGTSFKEIRRRSRARVQSFFTLSSVRPMRRATSGKVRPSRWRRISTSR